MRISLKSFVAPFTTMASPKDKLKQIRQLFPANKIGVYVVLTQDEHQSEYTGEADDRRQFISGFTGSAGTAVISSETAALATDGRYFLQAAKELDSSCWKLLKQGVKDVPTWQEYAVEEAVRLNSNIGVDPKLISYSDVKAIKKLLASRTDDSSLQIVPLNENLVDQVWGEEKPVRPKDQVWILDEKYTGKSFETKIAELSEDIEKDNGTAYVVSALDDIAWLFNLRCFGDIAYNPVFFSYAVIQPNRTPTLYIDSDKISEKVRAYLGDKVQVKDYNSIWDDMPALANELTMVNEKATRDTHKKLLVPEVCSWALINQLGGEQNVKLVLSPVELAKSIKNETEIKCSKESQIRDGAALVRYLAWLERELNGGRRITDYDAAVKSKEFRAEMEHFLDLSFETISSSGPMAAVIHYSPAKDSTNFVDRDQVYLLDSGGQYLDGTTDITRTVHYGSPSAKEREAYTLVLKGHIALASVVFPEAGSSFLDSLARQFLWKYGLDYRHGTGHGIGQCLNVHEGPIRIGLLTKKTPLKPGNLLSDEPGYYEDGKFGVRIESDMFVVEKETKYNFGDVKYLGFEVITMVPFCQNLLDLSLLTSDEKQWINSYHEEVFEKLRPYLKKDELALEYLRRETKPIF